MERINSHPLVKVILAEHQRIARQNLFALVQREQARLEMARRRLEALRRENEILRLKESRADKILRKQ